MTKMKVLIVEDIPNLLEDYRGIVRGLGYEALTASSGAEALKIFRDKKNHDLHLALLDWHLGAMDGDELIPRLRQTWRAAHFLVLTKIVDSVRAIDAGADGFLPKPLDPNQLKSLLHLGQREVREKSAALKQIERDNNLDSFIAEDPAFQQVLEKVDEYACMTDQELGKFCICINGETGTGKELLVRRMHYHPGSPRRNGPLVSVDCGTLDHTLIHSDLFGHQEDAFTGAQLRHGHFETAAGGTVFLDEVDRLPKRIQEMLLRTIASRTIRRLGSSTEIPIDVRIVAACKNLDKSFENEAIISDLYHRLNGLCLHIPPLRERGDLQGIAETYLSEFGKNAGGKKKSVTGLSPAALDLLSKHAWPGNVRELVRILFLAFRNCEGPFLEENDLRRADPNLGRVPAQGHLETHSVLEASEMDFYDLACRYEATLLAQELHYWEGRQSDAARSLHLKPANLSSMLKRLRDQGYLDGNAAVKPWLVLDGASVRINRLSDP